MRDEAITTTPTLGSAEAAVCYMLQRIRVDANLRYYMLDTEAFARLCAAEAARIGTDADSVEAIYGELAPHCAGESAEAVRLRNKLELIRAWLRIGDGPRRETDTDVLAKIERLLEE